MELIRGVHNLRDRHRGCVATIGNFDGIHLGHRAIIRQVTAKARQLGVPSAVMVFEPQPREFFAPDEAPARLMTFREKVEVLGELGVDRVLCVKFDRRFCSQSAQEFCENILIRGMGIRHLVVGDDFRFGNDRAGDFRFLQTMGEENGYTVENTHTFEWHGERVSSTRVRECLERSDFDSASVMLCRSFFMSGRVIHGQKLGRTIGVPTANLLPKRVRTPVSGVFAVEVRGLDQVQQGVANLGTRPTLGGEQVRLEVHLLDFQGDLYGQHLRVMFRHKIRDEKKFDGLEALTDAIRQDIETAKQFFAKPKAKGS
ncbi:bifunctional riboflavin kinase/FAD synthetase [Ketobacter sp.]|uniref:bifunctional riboflavin kinase/FAD synthetase n=1 Tax=Ketobacter sp. TaxID=2083498 RepID=UPI000F0E04C3|nr:bifunctional riboflavin kinase/FAD synthetase [Ketobacter sp.]RLU00867.1 MAG: bifunctional riboflavin kinase/FAD synthetase [Ketobacter sp.]